MATRRRPSQAREPSPPRWAVARRIALPDAANDNRLPASLRVARVLAFATIIAAFAWLIAEAF